jgi:hypothetical protein
MIWDILLVITIIFCVCALFIAAVWALMALC